MLSNAESDKKEKLVYRLVLTGGPCSGKTTGQTRLSTFLENYGWKVYRVPEAATVLLGGGVRFPDLGPAAVEKFQENLLLTMMAMEQTYFDLAEQSDKNCLVICDRGTMDASAFVDKEQWNRILKGHAWNPVDIRDNRYNHVVHLVSAAKGAEAFYNVDDNACRMERDLELARKRDDLAAQAWVGHPYIDVIDNSTDFNSKLRRLIECVCRRIGVDIGDRLASNSRKVKFLVARMPENDSVWPAFQDFEVVHDYLVTQNPSKVQSRLRKRGQNGNWNYSYTMRRCDNPNNQVIENMLAQRDPTHYTVYKLRRCFLWKNFSFQMDIYKQPFHARCKGLILLEVYTTAENVMDIIPDFLEVVKDVTSEPDYSMYNLSKKDGSNGKSPAAILASNASTTVHAHNGAT